MDHYLRPRDHERSAKMLTYITGVVLCLMIGLVIIGGIKKITQVSEILIPFYGGHFKWPYGDSKPYSRSSFIKGNS